MNQLQADSRKKFVDISPQTELVSIYKINSLQKIALGKLRIKTVNDLLYYFPVRYGDTAETRNISNLMAGEDAVIYGKINHLELKKAFRKGTPMAKATIEDESGKINAVWFNQPYIAKMFSEESLVRIEGRISEKRKENEKGTIYFSNPKIEKVSVLPQAVGNSLFGDEEIAHNLYPVYKESRGLTSNWIYHKVSDLFKKGILEKISDPLPPEILSKYNLPQIKSALIWMHSPRNKNDALSARKRFAFEEIFFVQLIKQKEKRKWQSHEAFRLEHTEDHIKSFVSRFPFPLTEAQDKAIQAILGDFASGRPMSRLLEGDVGSGKTAVGATTAYAVVTTKPKGKNYGNLQVAYMCPTEILATQQFESFIKYFAHLPIQIGLITGSGCRKFPSKINPSGSTEISRTQLLKWVANGEIPILVGTHALIQKSVKFQNLAYAIIDEQHRFGTQQRAKLIHKDMNFAPHLLSMTATPIPRTLALTMYGDLDLTLLDQMPAGRKTVITKIANNYTRDEVYEEIKIQLKKGRQCYVICPRIDEPDPDLEASLLAKSVKEEAKRLKKDVFKEYEIDIVHSKMSPKTKDLAMKKFTDGKTHILCSTSVVEVGVNIPNATVMIIEGGERFGLAQLHQLRGRVVRSNEQAYCYIFAESKNSKTSARLKAFTTAKNGFELAEYDLQFRGAGELSGTRQWGISDIAMEALQNLKMVEAGRTEAGLILDQDPELKSFPHISTKLIEKETGMHLE